MIDELYDRNYQAARGEMNQHAHGALAAIARDIGRSLAVFHRIQWSAPWASKPKGAGRA